jgi:co-chaperonin GroES (HSP10)
MELKSNLRAVGHNVIVEEFQPKEKKVGGIFLLSTSDIKTSKDKQAVAYREAKVISMGAKLDRQEFNDGDEVLFSTDNSLELAKLEVEGGYIKHLMIHGSEIMLVKTTPNSVSIDHRLLDGNL